MKRTWILLALVLCLLLGAVSANAAGVTWAYDSTTKTLTVSGTGDMEDYYTLKDTPWYDYVGEITTIVVEEGVISIGNNAFTHCTKVTSVTIPSTVTGIGRNAFFMCRALTELEIPAGVKTIGDAAFFSCAKLTGISVSPENTAYCSDAAGVLYNKDKTVLIQAPGAIQGSYQVADTTQIIKDQAFYGCGKLTGITLPQTLTEIGSAAFQNCSKLKTVQIPQKVTAIGKGAFLGCSALQGIYVEAGSTAYSSDASGVLFDLTKKRLIQAPGGLAGSYQVPGAVTVIGENAFWLCEDLVQVTLNANLRTIEKSAFSSCFGLTKVTFTGNAPVMEDKAFSGVSADAYYPENDATWTADVQKDYGGTLNWIPYDAKYPIASVSVSVGNTLGMYFWIPEANVADGDYAVVSKNVVGADATEVTVAKADWTKVGTYYLVPFTGIAAKEMMDEVTCTVYNAAGEQVSQPGTSSIRKYVNSQLGTTNASLKTLLIDMLNYGAAAQQEFAYDTGNLANKDLSETDAACATAAIDMEALGHHAVKGEGMYGGTLTLKSSILMNVFFETTTVTSDMTAKISYSNYKGVETSFEITGDQFQAIGTAYLVVNIETLVAADLATVVNVDIYDGETLVSHGEYNMAQYCQTMQSSPVAVALAKYCTSARNYLA